MKEVDYIDAIVLLACKRSFDFMIHLFSSAVKSRQTHGRKKQMRKMRSLK
jgi:hypothetical protein